jgi:hypothetical protein
MSIHRHHFFRLLLAIYVWRCCLGAGRLLAAEPTPANAAPNPLFTEAAAEFKEMKSTLYQHRTQVDRAAGIYRYDCVGFVSYELKRATPEAWASVFKATKIAPGRIPSPPKYRDFFASLATEPQPGWEAVTKATDLRAGDVIAWEHKTTSAVGHAVILASPPVAGAAGEWVVEVFDSTGSPHTDDSRPTDERAEALASSGKHSGLGRGTMVLLADPATGALTGLRWSKKAAAITVPIAAGRAVK